MNRRLFLLNLVGVSSLGHPLFSQEKTQEKNIEQNMFPVDLMLVDSGYETCIFLYNDQNQDNVPRVVKKTWGLEVFLAGITCAGEKIPIYHHLKCTEEMFELFEQGELVPFESYGVIAQLYEAYKTGRKVHGAILINNI